MALTANESGAWIKNNANVPRRFEQSVYERLLKAQKGDEPFGSIKKAIFSGMSDEQLKDYASSWGLTQIMGYNILEWEGWTLADIQNAERHYNGTLRLLWQFEHRFMLNPMKDFAEFFRCWNTGNPHGKTFDPNYVDNGLARMDTYSSLGESQ
jgi:hypothetical protein